MFSNNIKKRVQAVIAQRITNAQAKYNEFAEEAKAIRQNTIIEAYKTENQSLVEQEEKLVNEIFKLA